MFPEQPHAATNAIITCLCVARLCFDRRLAKKIHLCNASLVQTRGCAADMCLRLTPLLSHGSLYIQPRAWPPSSLKVCSDGPACLCTGMWLRDCSVTESYKALLPLDSYGAALHLVSYPRNFCSTMTREWCSSLYPVRWELWLSCFQSTMLAIGYTMATNSQSRLAKTLT
jgi:hypothetical protein